MPASSRVNPPCSCSTPTAPTTSANPSPLGPPPPDDDLPTTEDVLPPRSSIDNTPPPDGEEIAHYIAKSSTGRVLDAFGQGRADGWGMRPLDTISPAAAAELRENGLLKPYEDWRANSALTVNQALMRPAAAALDAASRANNGFSGLQSATAQAFADAGRPDLASDILSMPGALFGSLYSPGLATGELERARSLGDTLLELLILLADRDIE